MEKKELIALGLTEEQAKNVSDLLAGAYVPKTRLDEMSKENEALKQSLAKRDKQLEELKKTAGDGEAMKQQITALQKANAEAQKAHEAEVNKLKVDNAIESALVAAGARNTKAVRALFDERSFKLTEKGEVEGLSEAIRAVQKSDGYLFENKQNQQRTLRGFQPAESMDFGTGKAPKDMSYDELCAYFAENPDATL